MRKWRQKYTPVGLDAVEFDVTSGSYTTHVGHTKYEVEPSGHQYMRLRRTNSDGISVTFFPTVLFEAFAERYMGAKIEAAIAKMMGR